MSLVSDWTLRKAYASVVRGNDAIMKTEMTADRAGSVRLPILKQCSGSNPAHTQTHTETDTHTLYPLKTPLQFTAKAVAAKKENLFFSPPHHNVKSICLASLTKSQKKV